MHVRLPRVDRETVGGARHRRGTLLVAFVQAVRRDAVGVGA